LFNYQPKINLVGLTSEHFLVCSINILPIQSNQDLLPQSIGPKEAAVWHEPFQIVLAA
jgi:hypothetical protein